MQLSDYAKKRLSAARSAEVETHLSQCGDCRLALARVEVAHQGLQAMAQAPTPELGSVRTEATIRWARIAPATSVRPGFWAALVLSSAAAAVLLFFGRATQPQSQPRELVHTTRPAAAPQSLTAVATLIHPEVNWSHGGVTRALDAESRIVEGDELHTQSGGRAGL